MTEKNKIPEIDVTVVQRPVDVEFACPACVENHKIDYWKFVGEHGNPAEWNGMLVKCPHCGQELRVYDTDWD